MSMWRALKTDTCSIRFKYCDLNSNFVFFTFIKYNSTRARYTLLFTFND